MVLYALLTCTPLYVAGWLAILTTLTSVVQRLWEEYAVRKDRRTLAERYGKGSYALVTGGSDGYGKALAFSLAARGFNLILAARNSEKLEKVREEILRAHPGTKVELYICDFSQALETGFFGKLFTFASRFDVSMVVNNVGLSYPSHFQTYEFQTKTPEKLAYVLVTNTVAQACLHQLFLPVFRGRTHRCAFLDVSSVVACTTVLGFETYGATKTFTTYLNASLAAAFGHLNIDYSCVVLGTVVTQQTTFIEEAWGKHVPLVISSTHAAEAVLPFLGHAVITNGHLQHFITFLLIRLTSYLDDTLPAALTLRTVTRLKAASQSVPK